MNVITRTEVIDALEERLAGMHDNVSVYVGDVFGPVPTYENGTVKPYVGLWVGGNADDEYSRPLDALANTDATLLRVQTQCVGRDRRSCDALADLVSATLTNFRVGSKPVLPDSEQQRAAYPQTDSEVTPARVYKALVWRLDTQ